MVLIAGTDKMLSLAVRGRFGYTSGCGMARAGWSKCGSSKDFGGDYQRHRTAKGWGISRAKYRRPTNPQTETQQAWRAIFSAGWSGYNGLTDIEKRALFNEAQHRGMSGPNLYMSRWLQSQRA